MNSAFGLKESDLEKIISIIKDHPEVEEALIFGSRAKGNFKKGSDVDIALKGNLSFHNLSRINFELNEETDMPYKFDVLNYDAIKNTDLIEHINRVGIKFYLVSKPISDPISDRLEA